MFTFPGRRHHQGESAPVPTLGASRHGMQVAMFG